MQPRCIWSNKKSARLKEVKVLATNRWATSTREETCYVLPEYEAALRAYTADAVRHGKTLMILIGMSVVLILLATALGVFGVLSDWSTLLVVAGSMVLMGGALIRFPFPTPETIRMLGVHKSIRFARLAGWLTVGVGLLLPLLVALDSASS